MFAYFVIFRIFQNSVLLKSFAGRNFRGDKLISVDALPSTCFQWDPLARPSFRDKLSRTRRAKIKVREYKLSRMKEILAKFSYFHVILYFALFWLIFCGWTQKYDFVGINFRERPKNSRNSGIFYPRKFLPIKHPFFYKKDSGSVRVKLS